MKKRIALFLALVLGCGVAFAGDDPYELHITPITNIDQNLTDDTSLILGTGTDAYLLWETADANANAALLAMPEGGAVNVPVFVVGDASAKNADLTFFNGITDPTIAILSDDKTKYGTLSMDGTNTVVGTSSGQVSVPAGVILGAASSLVGDFTMYEATNDANPQIRIGGADAEELHIQAVYDSGAQTLDYVEFITDAASATGDKGKYVFDVDGTDVAVIDDGGMEITGSVNATTGFTDGTATLDGSGAWTGITSIGMGGTLTGVTTAITGTANNALVISVPDQPDTGNAAGVGLTIQADQAGELAGGGEDGGDVTIVAGAAGGDTGDKDGGDIILTPGAEINSGAKGNVKPGSDDAFSLGTSAAEWKDLYVDGTANIDALVADTADIDAGSVDGAAVGAASASTGKFTTLEATGLLTLSTTAGITASTTQSQGQGALTTTINEISTCANAGDTVTLPTAAAGVIVVIINNGAESANVFPASGDNIDGTGADTAVTQGAGANFIYVAHDADNWDRLHSPL